MYAAFSRLNELSVGDDVYVVSREEKKLHFKVVEIQIYALEDVPRNLLFTRHDGARLNLITCSGKRTADGSTYDHRLIVYTELVTE